MGVSSCRVDSKLMSKYSPGRKRFGGRSQYKCRCLITWQYYTHGNDCVFVKLVQKSPRLQFSVLNRFIWGFSCAITYVELIGKRAVARKRWPNVAKSA